MPGIHLDDLYLGRFQPFHRKAHILFVFYAFSEYQGNILIRTSGRDLISGVILGNASLHFCGPRS